MRRFVTILLTCVLATLASVTPSQSSTADNPSNETGTILDVGGYHACVITFNHEVNCWGNSESGATNVPPDLGKVQEISSGYHWTCAVTIQQQVRCWGLDYIYPPPAPADLGKVAHISVRGFFSCAITTEELARCWGQNYGDVTVIPSDLGKVQQISNRNWTVCAVTKDSLVRCWGSEDNGKTQVPQDLGKVTHVSVGDGHVCAIKQSGFVRCWGAVGWDHGQLSVPSDLGKVTQLQSGNLQTCAITEAQLARCWGSVYHDKNNVWNFYSAADEMPNDLGKVKQVSVGDQSACAVTVLDEVRCWGSNRFGQINVPSDLGKLYTPGPMRLALAPTPQVSGSSIIGNSVVAMPGSWDAGVRFSHQWLRDGVAIPVATSSSYTLQASDYLKKISVAVTGTKEGYISETKTSDVVIPVKPKEKIASLRFTGNTQVGSSVSVSPLPRNSKFDYSYQWFRNGSEILGANSKLQLLSALDVGASLSVKVCALYLKDVTNCLTQNLDSPVKLGLLKNIKASISGVAKVGRQFVASRVTSDSQTSVAYQWLRNETPIADATSNFYFVDSSDRGSSISLRVTVTKPGYETQVKTSSFKLIN
jgi:hypothetical protein